MAGIGGSPGVAGDQLDMPIAVAVDASQALYISEFGNSRVQKWLWGATNGTTVAGRVDGISGSGLSELDGPFDIAIDSSGGVYVADAWNNRIVYWSNGSSVGTMVAGTGKRTEHTCFVQSGSFFVSS